MTWACISRLSKNSSKNLNLNFTLMYTDLQIDCIRAFGDKELKFGCLMLTPAWVCPYITSDSIEHGNTRRIFLSNTIWWVSGNLCIDDNHKSDCKILWSEPHLFPDVAKKLREKGYNLEVLQWDTLTSIIRISRWDIKKPQIIEYKPCLPLLEQPQVMEQLLSLTK